MHSSIGSLNIQEESYDNEDRRTDNSSAKSHDVSVIRTKCTYKSIEIQFFGDPNYLIPIVKSSLLELYLSIK